MIYFMYRLSLCCKIISTCRMSPELREKKDESCPSLITYYITVKYQFFHHIPYHANTVYNISTYCSQVRTPDMAPPPSAAHISVTPNTEQEKKTNNDLTDMGSKRCAYHHHSLLLVRNCTQKQSNSICYFSHYPSITT